MHTEYEYHKTKYREYVFIKKSIQMLLQNMMIYDIYGNAIKVNPFILPYTCLQHIKF